VVSKTANPKANHRLSHLDQSIFSLTEGKASVQLGVLLVSVCLHIPFWSFPRSVFRILQIHRFLLSVHTCQFPCSSEILCSIELWHLHRFLLPGHPVNSDLMHHHEQELQDSLLVTLY